MYKYVYYLHKLTIIAGIIMVKGRHYYKNCAKMCGIFFRPEIC